jgi:hypothetical protein
MAFMPLALSELGSPTFTTSRPPEHAASTDPVSGRSNRTTASATLSNARWQLTAWTIAHPRYDHGTPPVRDRTAATRFWASLTTRRRANSNIVRSAVPIDGGTPSSWRRSSPLQPTMSLTATLPPSRRRGVKKVLHHWRGCWAAAEHEVCACSRSTTGGGFVNPGGGGSSPGRSSAAGRGPLRQRDGKANFGSSPSF